MVGGGAGRDEAYGWAGPRLFVETSDARLWGLGLVMRPVKSQKKKKNPHKRSVFSPKRSLLKGASIGGNHLIDFLVSQYIFEPGFIREPEVLSSRQNSGIRRPQEKVNGFYIPVG